MEKLTPNQIRIVHNHLIQSNSSDEQIDELLNRLVPDIEKYMWIGLPFESALSAVLVHANLYSTHTSDETNRPTLVMTDEQLRQASLDDIVFKDRNKAYGAYDLRRAYRITLRNALIMAIGLCMMGMAMLDLLSSRAWSYLSLSGAVWLLGLVAVTYAGLSWYTQHLRQQQMLAQ